MFKIFGDEIYTRNFQKQALLQEPAATELLEYCKELESEIVEFKFQTANSKELAMTDILQEGIKRCNDLEREQMEHDRSVMKRRNIGRPFQV